MVDGSKSIRGTIPCSSFPLWRYSFLLLKDSHEDSGKRKYQMKSQMLFSWFGRESFEETLQVLLLWIRIWLLRNSVKSVHFGKSKVKNRKSLMTQCIRWFFATAADTLPFGFELYELLSLFGWLYLASFDQPQSLVDSRWWNPLLISPFVFLSLQEERNHRHHQSALLKNIETFWDIVGFGWQDYR